MLRLILLILSQSILLVGAQTLLKISVQIFGKFTWSWAYFGKVFTTWQFAASGVCALAAFFVWMYTLRHYEFSVAYPLLGLSYIVGLFSAWLVLGEAIPMTRWIGVVIIVVGVFFVVK